METIPLDPSDIERYQEMYCVPERTILEIKKAFDIIDFNGNGSIQPSELEAMLEELGLMDNHGIKAGLL